MPAVETTYLKYLLVKIVKYFELKILSGFLLGTIGFLVDATQKQGMTALLMLIVIDFVSGIAVEKKRGVPIQSAKAFRSAIKTVVYFGLISAAHLSEMATQHVLPFLDETVLGFLAITELISVLENAGNLGFAIPQKLLNKLVDFKDNQ